MSIGEARRELESRFPGLVWDYLMALLVARGYAESAAGKVPRIVVTGPSGSAKSTTAQLAAAILGDEARVVPDTRTFREHLDRALSDSVGWAVCDEFAKPRRNGGSTRDPRMFLTMETRQWEARLLYIGSQSVTVRSAVVITGVQLPRGFDDLQLARRFVHVQLPEEVARWERTCGFGDVLRTRRHLPEVCDAVLSHVVDEWFALGDPDAVTFEMACESLGWGSVADTIGADDAFSPAAQVQALYALWREGEGFTPPPKRWQAAGRARFGFFDASPAADLWRELCDSPEGPGRRTSERVAALDLRKVLDVPRSLPGRVWLESRGDKASVCLRFMRGAQPLEDWRAEDES
jgi:energy-coupling factor transporter ATP-binding protein EcfA2